MPFVTNVPIFHDMPHAPLTACWCRKNVDCHGTVADSKRQTSREALATLITHLLLELLVDHVLVSAAPLSAASSPAVPRSSLLAPLATTTAPAANVPRATDGAPAAAALRLFLRRPPPAVFWRWPALLIIVFLFLAPLGFGGEGGGGGLRRKIAGPRRGAAFLHLCVC